jgi:hypothetical protein
VCPQDLSVLGFRKTSVHKGHSRSCPNRRTDLRMGTVPASGLSRTAAASSAVCVVLLLLWLLLLLPVERGRFVMVIIVSEVDCEFSVLSVAIVWYTVYGTEGAV